MRNHAVSTTSTTPKNQEEAKYSRDLKKTEMDDYDYENEGKVINLKYPKNLALNKIKR